MTRFGERKRLPESDAALAALLFAVDPHGLGGVVLRGMPGPVRSRWLRQTQALMPAGAPWLKVPINVSNDRLLGGLDFAATIGSGRPVFATGMLEAADNGVLVVSMAERVPASTAAIFGLALDRGELQTERDGIARLRQSHFGVVALDEGIEEDERLADGLADRLAFTVMLRQTGFEELDLHEWCRKDIELARNRLRAITLDEGLIEKLCVASAAFAIPSARAELLALRAARAACALLGRKTAAEEELAIAARLVYPQRAQRLPPTEEPGEQQSSPEEHDDVQQESSRKKQSETPPEDILVDAIRAAIPAGLLEALQKQHGRRRQQKAGGRGGPRTKSRRRGRPVGVRQCEQPGIERLNVLATLKAAAPWQELRRKSSGRNARTLLLRKEDLHVTRYQDRIENTTVFLVDASGSQAAQRLAEVKGAIELLLHDCYVRRDQVALIAFRGTTAEVMLPPTRALARVKRSLAALPGGGGTPLAAGLDSAREMAESIAHHGRIPAIVLMTDGRANISRDNQQGSAQAEEDALLAARLLRMAGIQSLLVDTSRRPRPRAQTLADAMGARYVPLPYADAATISATVQRNVA